MKIIRNIEYARPGPRPLRLDLYLPDAPTVPPLVIWIHGGAFRIGAKDPMPVGFLVVDGFAVASIEYRFSYEALFPTQTHDCKGAVRWLRRHAAAYGFDASRIGAAGSSAGGHLAAMLGASADVAALEGETGGNLEQSSAVQAVVDLYGPTNFLEMLGKGGMDHAAADSPESELVGGPIEQHPDRVRVADPCTYVTPAAAPFLIFHGDQDPLVPYQQSELLYAALQRHGVESELVILHGAGHGGPEFEDAATEARIRAFFRRRLR